MKISRKTKEIIFLIIILIVLGGIYSLIFFDKFSPNISDQTNEPEITNTDIPDNTSLSPETIPENFDNKDLNISDPLFTDDDLISIPNDSTENVLTPEYKSEFRDFFIDNGNPTQISAKRCSFTEEDDDYSLTETYIQIINNSESISVSLFNYPGTFLTPENVINEYLISIDDPTNICDDLDGLNNLKIYCIETSAQITDGFIATNCVQPFFYEKEIKPIIDTLTEPQFFSFLSNNKIICAYVNSNYSPDTDTQEKIHDYDTLNKALRLMFS